MVLKNGCSTLHMKSLAILPFAVGLVGLVENVVAESRSSRPLKPGEFEWHPELSTEGPVMVVVSRDDQLAFVYRNGIEIARATVSTGKPGHTTPTGVFHVLEKDADHRSSTYAGAPMPFMQRLTWDGIALHAGNLPGYPASHGCVRLPYEFAHLLYGITHKGCTVVVASEHDQLKPSTAPWALLSTVADSVPTEDHDRMFHNGIDAFWKPERQRDGHLAIVISGKDRAVHVLRNGVQIGQCPVALAPVEGALPRGAFVMLSKVDQGESPFVPGAPRHHWVTVSLDRAAPEEALWAFAHSLHLPRNFARALYGELQPGTLLLFTPDGFHPDHRSEPGFVIAAGERFTREAPPAR